MPRPIDHDERRRQIIEVTRLLIAEQGTAAVKFRTIAKRMGGSTSLVTHYFATQADLLKAIATDFVESWQSDLQKLEANYPDPLERLRVILLDWMVPVENEDLLNERVRINVVAAELQGSPDAHEMLDALEIGVKRELRTALRELVPKRLVEHYVDVICVVYNGLALSVVESPQTWTKNRQVKVMRTIVDLLPLERASASLA
jgi:AcrR family transcriptional regulator